MKTVFPHDTEVALAAAAALVNTLDGDQELMPDLAALDAFVHDQGWTGSRTHDLAELRAVRDLRPRLREIWEVDADRVVEIVNDLLASARALPQLVRHDSWDYHLHATTADAPLASRMAVEAAMGLVDVVRGEGARPAADLRLPDLRAGARRPLEEPLEAVLRQRLRQPRRGRRVPRPQRHHVVTAK